MAMPPPTQPTRQSILAIPGRTASSRAKVILSIVLSLPGCGPWLAEYGRSALEGSPWLHDRRWVTVEELLFLGAVVALLTTPIAIVLVVRHGRFVSRRLQWLAWLLAGAAVIGPLYVIAGSLGIGL
jgi:hypothetical protein